MPKKPIASFGLTSPVPPVSISPDADPLEQEAIKTLRHMRALSTIKLGRDDNSSAGHSEPPPASTLTEQTKTMVDMTKTTTDLYKDVAETHRQEAKDAQERVKETEEKAEKKAVQAAEDARKEGTDMLKLVKEINATHLKYVEDRHKTELDTEKRFSELESKLANAELQTVKTELKSDIESVKVQLEKKDEEIAELKKQRDYLAGKETLEDVIVHTLKTGEIHPTLQSINRLFGSGSTPNADPNHVFQSGMAGVLVDKAKVEVKQLENDLESKKTKDQKVGNLLDNLVGLVGDARGALKNFVGGGNVPNRREVPPGPPEAGANGDGDGLDAGEEAD